MGDFRKPHSTLKGINGVYELDNKYYENTQNYLPYHVYRLLDPTRRIEIKRYVDTSIPLKERTTSANDIDTINFPTKIWKDGQLHWEIKVRGPQSGIPDPGNCIIRYQTKIQDFKNKVKSQIRDFQN